MSGFILYFAYEEFFRGHSNEQELIEQVAKYDGYSILHFVRQINSNLRLWENGGDPASPKYLATVGLLLPNILGEELIFELKRSTSPRRAFFHTRQLLYLVKLAIKYCPLGEGLMFGNEGIEAGLILLKVNDQLHIQERATINMLSDDDRDYAFLSEFLAVNEFIKSDPGDLALRAYEMLFKMPEGAANKPFYINLETTFETVTGLQLKTYFAMCFALFVGTISAFYEKMDSAITFGSAVWEKSRLPSDVIQRFWKQLSISVSDAKIALASDQGNNDVTLFRRWPLIQHEDVRFGFDPKFFMEKLWAGPFWTIFHSSSEAKRKLPQLTGWLLEQYLNRLFHKTCGPLNEYVPQPRRSDEGQKELTDGLIICDNVLILMEFKAVMFTAEAKYSGDRSILRAEIEKKLVKNEQGKAKGVRQLDNAIEYLEHADLTVAVQGLDLSKINVIYPLIITLEALGDSLLISRILNRQFESLRTPRAQSRFDVKRLHCTGTATVEKIAGAFRNSSIASLLEQWDKADTPLRGSWRMFFDASLHSTGRDYNSISFRELEEQLLPLLLLHQ